MQRQLRDLIARYQPDVLWADGEWDGPDSLWQSREFLATLPQAFRAFPLSVRPENVRLITENQVLQLRLHVLPTNRGRSRSQSGLYHSKKE